jgi:hypothetical protein
VFRAKGDNEFLVCFFFAAFVQDTHVCLAAVKGLASFSQATGETVMDEGEFEDACVRIDSQWTVKCKCARKVVGRVRPRYVIDWPEVQLVDGFLLSFSKRYESDVPFRASRTDIEPEEAAASAGTSTSSAAGTGEVGSSPSD